MLKNKEETAKNLIENWLKEICPECEIVEWETNEYGRLKKVEEYCKIKLRIEGKIKIIKISWEDFYDVRDCPNWETSNARKFIQDVKQKLKSQLEKLWRYSIRRINDPRQGVFVLPAPLVHDSFEESIEAAIKIVESMGDGRGAAIYDNEKKDYVKKFMNEGGVVKQKPV